MQISFNPTINNNQPSFQAVNIRLMKEAEQCFKTRKNITSVWYNDLLDNLILWKRISKQDAMDTLLAVKKYVNKGSMEVYNSVIENIKRA